MTDNDFNPVVEIQAEVQVNPTLQLQGEVDMGSLASERNAEAWAVGQRGGVDVSSTDQTFHNNAKYWAEQAEQTVVGSIIDDTSTALNKVWSAHKVSEEFAETNGEVSDLKSAISDNIKNNTYIKKYLYKKDTYLNNGVETSLTGYDLYKIPVTENDIVFIGRDDGAFWYNLNGNKAIAIRKTDNSFVSVTGNTKYCGFGISLKSALIIAQSDFAEVYICIYAQYADSVSFAINKPYNSFVNDNDLISDVPIILSNNNTIKSHFYLNNYNDTFSDIGNNMVYVFPVSINDRIIFSNLQTGFSYYGTFRPYSSDTVEKINGDYTAQEPGVVCIFEAEISSGNTIFIPEKSLKTAGISEMTDGKKCKIVAGAVRNAGSVWDFIDNTGHNPMNLASVSVDSSGHLILDYGFTAKKVLTLVATPDETFASKYTIGGSVGLSNTSFNICTIPRTLGGMVYYDESTESWDLTNSDFTSASFNTSTGCLTLYHEDLTNIITKDKFKSSVTGRQCLAVAGGMGNNMMEVFFLDLSLQPIKTPSRAMRFYATREIGSYWIDASSVVSISGNFWIFGIMEV